MKPSFKMRGECAFIFEDIIDKALAILNRQFNVDIRYVEKPSLSDDQMYIVNIVENDLITYSVNFEKIFKGTLEFRFSRSLNIREIKKVNDLLNLSIKAPSQYYERYLLLDELQIQLQKQIQLSNNNVVNLNYFKHLKNRRNESDDDTNIIKKSHPPIYIEGADQEDKKNLAIELHYFLGFSSFVHFSDIEQRISNYKDLCELRDTTIYIENFDKLSHDKKLLFLDFFTEPTRQEQPLIISSSETDYAFLLRDTLNRTLLKFLSIHHIRLNKSLAKIKQDGFTTFLNSILKDPKHFTTH